MYFDGINLAEGSTVQNLTVQSGDTFPANATVGELFYKTGSGQGLFVYDGGTWVNFAANSFVEALSDVPFVISTSNASLPNALVLASIGPGFVKNSGGTLTATSTIDLSGSDVSGYLAATNFPALSGDLVGTNGSLNVALSNTGVTAGTYNKVTVDAKGRVTSAVAATTLAGLGIADAYTKTETDSRIQAVIGAAPAALDTLTELAAALGNDANFATTTTNALATKASISYVDSQIASVTAGNVATASAADKLTTARTIGMTGDVTWSVSFDGSANVSAAGTLANSGVTAGTYPKVTVNAKGLVTGGASLVAADIPSLDWSKISTGKPTTAAGYGIGDVYTKTEVDSSLAGKINTTAIGAANGVASLGADGKVPAAQLPSYVDDVLEYAATGNFPATGETGKIYVATGTSKTYRWSGSVYVEISAAPGSTDAVVEGSTNLYFTDARAQAAVANITIDGGSF